MALKLATLLACASMILAPSAGGRIAHFQRAAAGPAKAGADVPKFPLDRGTVALTRSIRPGSFFDVVGRRSAVFGYENRALEAWVYPLKIVDDFTLSFSLQGYPLDIHGPDVQVSIIARPEATLLTYSHAAFTVRQII